LIIFGCNYSGN